MRRLHPIDYMHNTSAVLIVELGDVTAGYHFEEHPSCPGTGSEGHWNKKHRETASLYSFALIYRRLGLLFTLNNDRLGPRKTGKEPQCSMLEHEKRTAQTLRLRNTESPDAQDKHSILQAKP